MKPRVLLDCDGVLADFHTPCLKIINELSGKDHKLEDLTEWNLFDALGVTDIVRKQTYDRMNKPGWCRDIQLYPGCVEGVKNLRQVANVYVCTSPMNGPTWTHERDQWLREHFDFTTKHIIHTSAKYVCAGDFLVDDRIDNLRKWEKCHPYGIPIRWVVPQYGGQVWDGVSMSDWDQLVRYVEKFSVRQRTWRHHE